MPSRASTGQVLRLRQKKRVLAEQGLAHEDLPPGKVPLTDSLTAERLARLEALGFVWLAIAGPVRSWEERLRDCVEYREEHGRWPSQSMGQMGEW